jgi:HEAT repeat protein/outer membrane lipoprotein YfiO
MRVEAKEMLNLTLNIASATKRVTLLFVLCIVAFVAASYSAPAQQRTSRGSSSGLGPDSGSGLGQGSGSGSGSGKGVAQQNDAITVFRSARDLITDGEWAKAQEKFSEYVSSYPNEKNIEAALYWLAYTQNKLTKYDQCRATIERLLEKYPNTSWKDDARVLLAQVPGNLSMYRDMVSAAKAQPMIMPSIEQPLIYSPKVALPPIKIAPGQGPQGVPVTVLETPPAIGAFETIDAADDDDPCEFKIVVLQALFETDLQRGIIAATEWLKPGSTQTPRCKSAALTLLGRNGGKSVTPVILGVARNEPDLKLRARAISTLGATNDDSVIDALRDFALNSPDKDIVEASLYALSKHTSERAITVLAEVATSSKVTNYRKMAISSISSRPGEPAVDALFRIYDADPSVDIRKAVISGFANRKSERAGAKLFELARSSDNIELRKAAVSAISRRGGDKAIEFLLSLYDTEKNEELRDQIINSLGSGSSFYAPMPVYAAPGQTIAYSGGSRMSDQRVIRKLIEIARDPKAPMERRKRAIGWLSRSKDPEVLKFLEELLNQ